MSCIPSVSGVNLTKVPRGTSHAIIPGIPLDDEQLLRTALTHRSFLSDHPEREEGISSNERLEFLGDAVLNLLASDWLYARFPEASEGDLSHYRSALVRTATLAQFARQFDLGNYVRISRGEEHQSGRDRDTLLANVFEAILGALYLSGGLERVSTFLTPLFEQVIDQLLAGEGDKNYRTLLQELLQARSNCKPIYRTVDEQGPQHCRQFTVEVLCGEEVLGMGTGRSKQLAAKEAARVALERLTRDER